MSSAVAMNRRISKENQGNGGGLPPLQQGQDHNTGSGQIRGGRGPRKVVKGTPVQQCWQVLNFHEKRLNRIDQYIFAKESGGKEGTAESNVQMKEIMQKLRRLEQENAAFRQHLMRMNQQKSNTVSLEVSEE